MFRSLRRMPFLKLLSVAQIALLTRRHLQRLDAGDRHRLSELVRRGRRMDRSERDELRRLLGKLEPRALAAATADAFSPVPLPRRLAGRSAR
jgi:hypothetical protein